MKSSGFEIVDPFEGAAQTERAQHAHYFCQYNTHPGSKKIDQMVLQERLQLVGTAIHVDVTRIWVLL